MFEGARCCKGAHSKDGRKLAPDGGREWSAICRSGSNGGRLSLFLKKSQSRGRFLRRSDVMGLFATPRAPGYAADRGKIPQLREQFRYTGCLWNAAATHHSTSSSAKMARPARAPRPTSPSIAPLLF